MHMRKHLILGTALTALFISGCANMSDTQRRTATGAGVGALAGAVISSATGGSAGTGAVIGAGVGALGTYVWSQNMDNQLKLDIPSDISFDVGRSDVKGNFAPVLDRFAASLRANQSTDVRIVGHTDNTGSDAINNPLSVDRANSTRNYLTARGVSGARIQTEGQGSYQPIASNNTAEGRSRNRRVEIFVGERPRN